MGNLGNTVASARVRAGRLSRPALGGLAFVAAIIVMSGCAPVTSAAPDASTSPSTTAPSDSSEPTTTAPAPKPSEPDEAEGPETPAPLPTVDGKIDDGIELSTGMSVELASIKKTKVTAETPGEMSGPAVVVTVKITNTSSERQNVDSAVVSLTTDDGEIGIPTLGGGSEPFAGNVAPGRSATARYVFMLDPAGDREVTISVNYAAGEPVAQFSGRTP